MSLEELRGVGLERMDQEAVRDFLLARGVGILGLADAGVPYLLPMSFGYDGEDAIYFTYVLGGESRKEALTEQADQARFLVYSADSAFTWESVLLRGTIESLEEDLDSVRHALSNAWHPNIFEDADLSRGVTIYRFTIEEWDGIRQAGLPDGLAGESAEN